MLCVLACSLDAADSDVDVDEKDVSEDDRADDDVKQCVRHSGRSTSRSISCNSGVSSAAAMARHYSSVGGVGVCCQRVRRSPPAAGAAPGGTPTVTGLCSLLYSLGMLTRH